MHHRQLEKGGAQDKVALGVHRHPLANSVEAKLRGTGRCSRPAANKEGNIVSQCCWQAALQHARMGAGLSAGCQACAHTQTHLWLPGDGVTAVRDCPSVGHGLIVLSCKCRIAHLHTAYSSPEICTGAAGQRVKAKRCSRVAAPALAASHAVQAMGRGCWAQHTTVAKHTTHIHAQSPTRGQPKV